MDTIDSCKGKLASLRIKDLKDILTQLGISKQGKKQDLVERIITIFSSEQAKNVWTKKKTAGREEIAKLVDDAYRKVQVSGATDVASKGQDESDGSSIKINCLVNDPSDYDKKVRCLCGSFLEMDSLIKCEDIKCSVWQHFKCVIIPEKPMEVSPLVPSSFYCELCRLNRADPFWVTVSNPLFPVKLITTNVPTDGSNPWQSAERTFQLTRADKDLLMKPEYDVQAWCMLLNDKVLFRMQWPQYADLQVNGVPIRVINRPGQQPLGANGRDDGAIITPCTKDGINKIVLTGCDARVFCLGVRIVKRQTVQQILKLIPKESDGECFDDALARVCRCVGGGNEAENADSDSDIEVVADFITVNLRCPMSGLRMKVVGRFKPCAHMGCFDLEVFVELNQRSRKWQCPICLKNYSLEDIIIDPYFNRITSKMRNCDEDVTEVEVKPDGSWRVKCKTENERRDLQDLAEWHLPNGSLSSPVSVANQNVAIKMQVKQEESENATGLKLGIRKNPSCFWEFNRPEGLKSSGSRLEDKLFGCNVQNVIPMSSSATGSGRDEDQSINQESSGILDFANNGIELDSTCLNIDSLFGVSDRNLTTAARNTDVIVLTDSDEENDVLISSGPANNNWQIDGSVPFPLPSTGIADSFPDNATGKSTGPSSLALCSDNAEEFGMHLWQSTPGIGGQGFQLFSTDAGVSGLVDLPRYSSGMPSGNSFLSGTEPILGSSDIVDNSLGQNHMNIHDSYTVYPYPFDGDDPSLQIFLPTRPDNELTVPHVRAQGDVSNILRSDDWISLRLGDGGGNNHDISPSTSVFGKPQHMSSRNEEVSLGAVDLEQIYSNGLNTTSEHAPSDDALNITQQMPSTQASVLPGVNNSRSEKANRQKSDGVFSFPRQKRSVRPRLHLSIGSGSE